MAHMEERFTRDADGDPIPCDACDASGIALAGPVEARCGSCRGTGIAIHPPYGDEYGDQPCH